MAFEPPQDTCAISSPTRSDRFQRLIGTHFRTLGISRGEFGLRGSKQVKERGELTWPRFQEIDQGPRFRVQVTAVAVAKPSVSDQWIEGGWYRKRSPLGDEKVIRTAHSGPAPPRTTWRLTANPSCSQGGKTPASVASPLSLTRRCTSRPRGSITAHLHLQISQHATPVEKIAQFLASFGLGFAKPLRLKGNYAR